MTKELPEPLTPADCDLTNFEYMPLLCARLRKSRAWLICKRRPELAFYMVNLWTASWHEVPAASLEDDDDVLADRAMCPPDKWTKVRVDVLRGFVKCSDGRLYHTIVAERAVEAWAQKQSHAWEKEADRIRKENKRRSEKGLPPLEIPPKPDGRAPDILKTSGGIPAENALKGKGRERERERENLPAAAGRAASTGNPTGFERVVDALGGFEQVRKWTNLREVAATWLAEADLELDVLPVIRERLASLGRLPNGPGYFTPAIRDHRERRLASASPQPTTPADPRLVADQLTGDREHDKWRNRVRIAWLDNGSWDRDWGPTPDEPGCMVPPDLMPKPGLRPAQKTSAQQGAPA